MKNTPINSIKSFQFNFSNTLTFYIIKNYLLWFIALLLAFFALIEIFEIKDIIRISHKYHDLTFLRMMSISSLKIPYIVDKIFPFIVFFAATFSLLKMNRGKELIFCQSTGMSLLNIVAPYIIATFLIQLFYLAVYNPISSTMFEKHLKLERIYYNSKFAQISFLDDNIWMMRNSKNSDDKYFIKAKSINTQKSELQNVNMIVVDNYNNYKETLYAKKAVINNKSIDLKKVSIAKIHMQEESLTNMLIPIKIDLDQIKNTIMPPDAINFWYLGSYSKMLKDSGLSVTEYKIRWHKILSMLLINIAFIILAAWATIRNVRFSSQISYIALSITIAFALFIFNNMTMAMGQSGEYPPIITIWIPAIISLMIAWNLLLKLEESY